MLRVMVTLFTFHFSLFTSSAQGWPENYGGVMLQGFYWDSFDDTRWLTLEKQANDLASSFDLIWIPQSATVADSRWATTTCGGLTTTTAPSATRYSYAR